MNTTHPTATDTEDYESDIHRHCAEWDAEMLLRLRPMTEGIARDYLGACNKYNRDTELKEHFAQQVQRLR